MDIERVLRGLRYEQEKRKNDFVGTCQTNISLMCKDAADTIEKLLEELEWSKIDLERNFQSHLLEDD